MAPLPVIDLHGSDLPIEMWEKILAYFEDPNDSFACSRVWKPGEYILAPTVNIWAMSQCFANIQGNLSVKDILNCRLVCKDWSIAVDRCLDEDESGGYKFLIAFDWTDWVIEPNDDPRLYHDFSRTNIPQDMELSGMFTAMRDHPRNPFVGRKVILEFSKSEMDFLSVFGVHIWHLKLKFIKWPAWKDDEFVAEMQELLEKVPNLRSLVIGAKLEYDVGHDDADYQEYEESDPHEVMERKIEALKNHLKQLAGPYVHDWSNLKIKGRFVSICRGIIYPCEPDEEYVSETESDGTDRDIGGSLDVGAISAIFRVMRDHFNDE